MKDQMVGVIGAGVMGVGVANSLASAGYRVCLVDLTQEKLDRARSQIAADVRLQIMLNKRAGAQRTADVMGNIAFATDIAAVADTGFVIENVTENWEIKQQVYRALDAVCRPEAVLAANTSAMPITKIAGLTNRPANVLGMHFMNPVPMKPVVEVIRGFHTSQQTLDAASRLLEGMGKRAVIVNDSPGFVSNRVLMLTVNEAIFLVQEGVASAADVDQIFRECFGHKMGPLETADLIGLDTILLSLGVLFDNFKDSKFRPCPLLSKMVDAGLHGRKSGQGFYTYMGAAASA
jgi:3-hydroxybutyryl-CoA dehydrogenase